ncbi:hypothetical protein WA158_005286 [Blastocystis sp. Blastoise]
MSTSPTVQKLIQDKIGIYCSPLFIHPLKMYLSSVNSIHNGQVNSPIEGYVVLLISRKTKTHFIKIFRESNYDIQFELELTKSFNIQVVEEDNYLVFLHYDNSLYNFVFLDNNQGYDFYMKLIDINDKLKKKDSIDQQVVNKKDKKGFFSLFKKGKKIHESTHQNSLKITLPMNYNNIYFEQVQHWDNNQISDTFNSIPFQRVSIEQPRQSVPFNSLRLSKLISDEEWDEYIASLEFDKSPTSSFSLRSSYDSDLRISLPLSISRPNQLL